jgi:hypothetical protein
MQFGTTALILAKVFSKTFTVGKDTNTFVPG